jgi:hypothetical protein
MEDYLILKGTNGDKFNRKKLLESAEDVHRTVTGYVFGTGLPHYLSEITLPDYKKLLETAKAGDEVPRYVDFAVESCKAIGADLEREIEIGVKSSSLCGCGKD